MNGFDSQFAFIATRKPLPSSTDMIMASLLDLGPTSRRKSPWAAAWRSPTRRGAALWPAKESCPKHPCPKAQIYAIHCSANIFPNPGPHLFKERMRFTA